MTAGAHRHGSWSRRLGAVCASILIVLPAACSRDTADGTRGTRSTGGAAGAGTGPSSPAGIGAHGQSAAAADQPFTVVAAGDIAARCSPTSTRCGHRRTADRIAAINPTYVITLGDNQYDRGTLQEYRAYYARTWGRFKARTFPAAGNHEYAASASAAGYRSYFGSRATPAGRTWYAWNRGAWHFVVLDSDLPLSPGSAQLGWLTADLAANRRRCVAAYWHHPRFSSGPHGDQPVSAAAWRALHAARADLVLNGHDHLYERFAPQTPRGQADGTGIREIIVGTGGGPAYRFKTPRPNSVRRVTGVYAVLALTLTATGYSGRLIGSNGRTLDAFGPTPCH